MELVRLGQSYFMIGDRHMYDNSSDSRFQCRSLNINEDLGQIRYVFSDKMGTLIENKMEFRKASVWGKQYGSTLTLDGSGDKNIGAEDVLEGRRKWKLKYEITPDTKLLKLLLKDFSGGESIAAHEFLLTLAACNIVIPIPSQCPSSRDTDGTFGASYGIINYQGESPDEQALVT